MPRLTPFSEIDPVQYLITVRYPLFARYSGKRVTLRDVTNGYPIEDINQYREELEALPVNELLALVERTRVEQAEKNRIDREEEEKNRPHNLPTSGADFAHWARCSYWTLEEAVALSLAKEPRLASWDQLKHLIGESPFASIFAKRRDLILRAKVMGQLWDQTIPRIFVDWAERMKVAPTGKTH